MERHRTKFKRNRRHNKQYAQFQQPSVHMAIRRSLGNGGKVQAACRAVNHGNTIQQDTGCQRAQNKILQRGFRCLHAVAAQRNHGIQRKRQQLQADICRQKMCAADHHAHARCRKHRQGIVFALEHFLRLVIRLGIHKQRGRTQIHRQFGQLRHAVHQIKAVERLCRLPCPHGYLRKRRRQHGTDAQIMRDIAVFVTGPQIRQQHGKQRTQQHNVRCGST